jgi:hypothetical protein
MMSGQQLVAFKMTPMAQMMAFLTASIESTLIFLFSQEAKITGKRLFQNGQPSEGNGGFKLQKKLAISVKKSTVAHMGAIKK